MAAKIKTVTHHKNRRHKNKPRGLAKHDFEKVYWPYLPLLLIVGLLFSLGVQSGSLRSGLNNPVGKTLDYSLSMNIDRLLDETNTQRQQNGARTLKHNSKLFAAAQAKANDMATKDYWSHYTPAGEAPWIFVAAQEYQYQKLGENLATGFLDESGTIKGWMASEGHRKNLLDPAFSEVGFGVANNPDYTSAGGGPMTIIVAMYGKPAGSLGSAPVSPAAPSPAKAAPLPQTPVAAVQPSNTETLSPDTKTITASRLTGAQLALASLPFASISKALLMVTMLAAVGLWLTKHAFGIHRAWATGEAFMIRHPVIDVGLIVIALLCLLLTRTAGIVG